MSMTLKDYQLLAATLKDAVVAAERTYGSSGLDASANTARAVARALERTQPNFNRARFLQAVGVRDFDGVRHLNPTSC